MKRRRSLAVRAPAKINLHLDVGPRRPDGYHSLITAFQQISLADSLLFRATTHSALHLTVAPAGVSAGPDNLVLRALALLKERLRIPGGMRARLRKRIPVGAGLGGGSSDAAAALWAGWILWKGESGRSRVPSRRRTPRPPALLLDCARRLGADVPFFLTGGLALARGIGERLRPLLPLPARWLVLVYPRVHVSTREAYQRLDRSRSSAFRWRPSRVSSTGRQIIVRGAGGPFNSFEKPILKKFPAIRRAHDALKKMGCGEVMMSGSGSSVFGFVRSRARGERIRAALRRRGWTIFVVKTESRRALTRRAR